MNYTDGKILRHGSIGIVRTSWTGIRAVIQNKNKEEVKMIWVIRKFGFWSIKRTIINACLSGMSGALKTIMIGQVMGRQLPHYHIRHNSIK